MSVKVSINSEELRKLTTSVKDLEDQVTALMRKSSVQEEQLRAWCRLTQEGNVICLAPQSSPTVSDMEVEIRKVTKERLATYDIIPTEEELSKVWGARIR